MSEIYTKVVEVKRGKEKREKKKGRNWELKKLKVKLMQYISLGSKEKMERNGRH